PIPGALFPDGALSDGCRTIGLAGGNFGKSDGKIGALHFWVKPNFNTAISTRIRSILYTLKLKSPHFYKFCNREQALYYFSNNNHNNETYMEYYVYNPAELWLPTRSLALGWGYNSSRPNSAAMFSPTVNHKFPGHSNIEHGLYHEYNFEGRQWNHLGITWNQLAPIASSGAWVLGLTVNGENVDATRSCRGVEREPSYSMWQDTRPGLHAEPNVFRFGSSVLGHHMYPVNIDSSGQPDGKLNYIGDHTIDDVIGYLDFVPGLELTRFWYWGRYYSENDATYTSPAINLLRELKLDRREILRPRSVSWTVYWPKHNRDGDRVADNILPPNVNGDILDSDDPNDPVPDDPLAAKWGAPLDPVSVDIGIDDGTETTWMYGNDLSLMPTYAGGSELKSLLSGADDFSISSNEKLRFQVRFNLAENQILYDTPVFDDITFTFQARPRILEWIVVH
ncbi:hypothetical protein ACFL54_08620, partial [Planctomycetota bacterium]